MFLCLATSHGIVSGSVVLVIEFRVFTVATVMIDVESVRPAIPHVVVSFYRVHVPVDVAVEISSLSIVVLLLLVLVAHQLATQLVRHHKFPESLELVRLLVRLVHVLLPV